MWEEYMYSPEAFLIAVFVLIFAVVFSALVKLSELQKPIVLLISFAIASIALFYLYKQNFYDYIWLAPYLFGLAVAGVFVKVIWAFIKHITHQF